MPRDLLLFDLTDRNPAESNKDRLRRALPAFTPLMNAPCPLGEGCDTLLLSRLLFLLLLVEVDEVEVAADIFEGETVVAADGDVVD